MQSVECRLHAGADCKREQEEKDKEVQLEKHNTRRNPAHDRPTCTCAPCQLSSAILTVERDVPCSFDVDTTFFYTKRIALENMLQQAGLSFFFLVEYVMVIVVAPQLTRIHPRRAHTHSVLKPAAQTYSAETYS